MAKKPKMMTIDEFMALSDKELSKALQDCKPHGKFGLSYTSIHEVLTAQMHSLLQVLNAEYILSCSVGRLVMLSSILMQSTKDITIQLEIDAQKKIKEIRRQLEELIEFCMDYERH